MGLFLSKGKKSINPATYRSLGGRKGPKGPKKQDIIVRKKYE
jgi:hypothetical protein